MRHYAIRSPNVRSIVLEECHPYTASRSIPTGRLLRNNGQALMIVQLYLDSPLSLSCQKHRCYTSESVWLTETVVYGTAEGILQTAFVLRESHGLLRWKAFLLQH